MSTLHFMRRFVLAAGLATALIDMPWALAGAPVAPASQPSDATVTARVQSALRADPKTAALEVRVKTHEGVVTLSGSVADNDARMEAVHVVQGVSGVVKVENDMDVRTTAGMTPSEKITHAMNATGDAVTDGWVSTKVKAALLAADDLKGASIAVSTKDGRVTLTGTVPAASMALRAAKVARAIDGVKSVDIHALRLR